MGLINFCYIFKASLILKFNREVLFTNRKNVCNRNNVFRLIFNINTIKVSIYIYNFSSYTSMTFQRNQKTSSHNVSRWYIFTKYNVNFFHLQTKIKRRYRNPRQAYKLCVISDKWMITNQQIVTALNVEKTINIWYFIMFKRCKGYDQLV